MKQFSIALAGPYASDGDVNVHALFNQIISLNTSDLWRVVAAYVFPPPFQKFIINRVPPSFAKFLSYLDQFAKLYNQRVAMDYEIRRSNDFKDTSIRIFSYFTLSTKSLISSPGVFATHPPAWQQTDPCPIDQLCNNCKEVGLHLTANCPDLIQSSSGNCSSHFT